MFLHIIHSDFLEFIAAKFNLNLAFCLIYY